jgi:hypothetical protein
MKTIRFAMLVFAVAILASCGGKPQNTGTTTPVDSTNMYGTAPVEYGAKDPAKPVNDYHGGAFDTGMKANTMNHEDSVREGLKK